MLTKHFKNPDAGGTPACLLVGQAAQPLPHPAQPYTHTWEDVAGMCGHPLAGSKEHAHMKAGQQGLVVHLASTGAVPQKAMPVLAGVLQSFPCNNFAITDTLVVSQAAGIYPLGALLNHSCAPNCVITYEPRHHTQVIRTTCCVAAGEELTHPFLDVLADTPARQGVLKEEYGFDCACPRCSACAGVTEGSVVEPDMAPITARGLATAAGAILPPVSGAPASTFALSQAEECVAAAQSLLERGGSVEEELSLLTRAAALTCGAVHPLHRLQVPTHNRCLQTALAAGQPATAARHCAITVALYAHHYSTVWPDLAPSAQGDVEHFASDAELAGRLRPGLPAHPLVALQLATLGDLLTSAGVETVELGDAVHPKAQWLLECVPHTRKEAYAAAVRVGSTVYGADSAFVCRVAAAAAEGM